jgi:hypothetical protein
VHGRIAVSLAAWVSKRRHGAEQFVALINDNFEPLTLTTGLSSPARLPERTGGEEQAQQQLQLAVVELAKAVNSAAAAITDRSVALTPRTRGLVPRLNSVCEELLTGLAGMVVTRHLCRIQRIHVEQPRLARLSASEHRRCG